MTMAFEPSGEAFDHKELRRAFGTFATGVTVLTVGGPRPHGMTASSFTTVSLEPPLVLVCVDRSAVMHEVLGAAPVFGVSVLAGHQEEQARYFANRQRPRGLAQFDDVDWYPGRLTGVPLIADAVAHFECEVWQRYDGGDHTIVVGRPICLDRQADGNALLFCGGQFGQHEYGPREVSAAERA